MPSVSHGIEIGSTTTTTTKDLRFKSKAGHFLYAKGRGVR